MAQSNRIIVTSIIIQGNRNKNRERGKEKDYLKLVIAT